MLAHRFGNHGAHPLHAGGAVACIVCTRACLCPRSGTNCARTHAKKQRTRLVTRADPQWENHWAKSFGVKEGDAPVTNDTTFEAASLSKVVFAYAVLKLADQGKIDLDAPLQDYLDASYIEGDPRVNAITARLVLTHRTGFPNWRPKQRLTIHFEPGDHFSYSGEGFVFLGKAVERITGQSLNEFIQQMVFTPLDMTSSSYVWRQDYDARTAIGHDKDRQAQDKWKPKEANPASSLQTTALDDARFMTALLHGKGLNPDTLKQMETPQTAVQQNCTANCFDVAPLSTTISWGPRTGLGENLRRSSLLALG